MPEVPLSPEQVQAIRERATRWMLRSDDTDETRQLAFAVLSTDLPRLCDDLAAWRALAGRYLAQHDEYWQRVLAKAPRLESEWPRCPCDICCAARAPGEAE